MDDIALIGHMTGGGEELVRKLKEKNLVDLKDIINQKPADLAKQLEVNEELGEKIASAAKAIYKPEVTAAEPSLVGKKTEKVDEPAAAVVEKTAKVDEPVVAISKKIQPMPKTKKGVPLVLTKEKKVYMIEKSFIKKHWKIVLSIAGLALIGFLLKGRE